MYSSAETPLQGFELEYFIYEHDTWMTIDPVLKGEDSEMDFDFSFINQLRRGPYV